MLYPYCFSILNHSKTIRSVISLLFLHSRDITSLQLRRKISRLQALFKIIHQDYSLSIPPHFISMTRSTRLYHPHRFILPNSSTYAYQQSFFSRSIKDWNNLPSSIIESNNIDSFSAELQTLYGTQ